MIPLRSACRGAGPGAAPDPFVGGPDTSCGRAIRGDAHTEQAVRAVPAGPAPGQGFAPWGLEDRVGRLIDGDPIGQPGGNAVAALRNGGATIRAVVDQGIGIVPSFELSAV